MRLAAVDACGWCNCTKHLQMRPLRTAFKEGDVGIHLHVQYDPVKEMVMDAKTYTVPNEDDEPPPPSPDVLQKIEEKAMVENGACRQKMSQVNKALRDAPKLPQDLFGPVESGIPQDMLAILQVNKMLPSVPRSSTAKAVKAKIPSQLSHFL
eukprot:symbB.v1.2.004289.t1/scaffold220.1/size262620/13